MTGLSVLKQKNLPRLRQYLILMKGRGIKELLIQLIPG